MVEHAMRLAAYLCTSRHGIYYFRFPLPTERDPARKRRHLKVSLGTRDPKIATRLARLLSVAGHSILDEPTLRSLQHDEIRQHLRAHFDQLLHVYRDNGTSDGWSSARFKTAQENARRDPAGFATPGTDALLQTIRAACDIPQEQGDAERLVQITELLTGLRDYFIHSAGQKEDGNAIATTQDSMPNHSPIMASVRPSSFGQVTFSLKEVASLYFEELKRTDAVATKTESDKRDALALLSEITGDKPLTYMTKADAQKVKAVLFKLPKNRRRSPKTRDLSLTSMLDVKGVERISTRTTNVYIGNMQSFFTWAVNNGYAENNIFAGLRVKRAAKTTEEGRKAFSAEELQLMFSHLTSDNSDLVRKTVHKWPTLIAMFTGMRLNEVAQLEVRDIELNGDIWCINVTADGTSKKRLKNSASKRRVPVHERLFACGFLDFHSEQKPKGHPRLFPELTYSDHNGCGRNIGRWFNERFLLELGLGGRGYVFHCLRHTMITRLAQADVEEPMVKALAGHSQSGVTLGTYFKAGFLPAQLQNAINKFSF
ncbi:tyrosine-type recombinase/integrase [Acidimangrovimonas pyrenivorans]|uniref:Tyrosine-type recombinase/integrase n=1 Tax=Acidimangrovimonas pyrenivorans TaxID=2030798 RepID=A0ABV7AID1_9RHOB